MMSITIALDDVQVARLRRFADRHEQTLEQAVQSLIEMALPDASTAQPLESTLALVGIIDDPAIAPLSAREIDELLAAEAARRA